MRGVLEEEEEEEEVKAESVAPLATINPLLAARYCAAPADALGAAPAASTAKARSGGGPGRSDEDAAASGGERANADTETDADDDEQWHEACSQVDRRSFESVRSRYACLDCLHLLSRWYCTSGYCSAAGVTTT
jgi:hypothetical protein